MEQEEEEELEEDAPYEYDDDDIELLIGIQRAQAIVLIIVVGVSVLTNISVLYLLASSPRSIRLSTRVRKQILIHLCVGDLAYAIFTIVPRTINILTFPRFYGGHFLCRFVKFLQLIPVYACPFLMVVCSIERYSNIRKFNLDDQSIYAVNRGRISWRLSRSFVHVMCFWAWLTAMILSTPNILSFRYVFLDETGTIGTCLYQIRESYERVWMTFLTCTTWIIPFCLTVLFFSLALVRYFAKPMDRLLAVFGTVDVLEERREHLRLLILIGVIVIIKFGLWTPFNVTNIVGSYWRTMEISDKLSVAVTLACNCACCVASIGYILHDHRAILRRIRTAFMKCAGRAKVERREKEVNETNAVESSLHERHTNPRERTSTNEFSGYVTTECGEKAGIVFLV